MSASTRAVKSPYRALRSCISAVRRVPAVSRACQADHAVAGPGQERGEQAAGAAGAQDGDREAPVPSRLRGPLAVSLAVSCAMVGILSSVGPLVVAASG
ncbi:hypothetical protein SALBM311S_00770 [Streptomyces alboniger]